ncbi:oligosaccharide flippase family protein [Desulfobulbus propionicus]|nr:oligosaccharide flippase family protein [Desulfobulbus propionicus]
MLFKSLKEQLCMLIKWRPGKIAKGTLVMTLGISLRTLGQALVFIIAARALGIEEFGAYAAVLALAGAFGGFGGLGFQTILLRDVSRNPECFPEAWGRALFVICWSSFLLMGLYTVAAWALLPGTISWNVISSVGCAEIIFSPFYVAALKPYQSDERAVQCSWLMISQIIVRVAAVLALVALIHLLPQQSPLEIWGHLYALAAFITGTYTLVKVSFDFGLPQWTNCGKTFTQIHEGLLFALGGATLKLHADIDKTMIARLATLEGAGLYSAAYRIVEMATIPIMALMSIYQPRFFREAQEEHKNSSFIPWNIFPIPLCYVLLACPFIYIFSMWIPIILGNSFSTTVLAIKWLSFLPIISLPRIILQTKFFAYGFTKIAVLFFILGTMINIIINLLLIPSTGWKGAVIATYISESIIGLTLFFSAKKFLKKCQ